jgi:hypothetical protein
MPLGSGDVLRFRLHRDDVQLRWSEVIQGWQDDSAFRSFFIALLADAPFPAYFWESPPVSGDSIDQDFEFVLANSPQLADIRTDKHAFTDHFSSLRSGVSVIDFANLGGDATLVVPCPGEPLSAYSQIAAFSRGANDDQQHKLWASVGATFEHMIGRQPVWLSTSGLGVYWVHLRLDSSPKYYTHEPYRELRYSGGYAA